MPAALAGSSNPHPVPVERCVWSVASQSFHGEPGAACHVLPRMIDDLNLTPLFKIEGPDEDGCVWICSPDGATRVWCENLGPKEQAAQVMSRWLGSVGYDEVKIERYERPNPG